MTVNLNNGSKNGQCGPRFAEMSYRPCVGILLFNDKGEVFVGQRIDTTAEAWQLPQGGVDQGESPRDAALRELEEEVGTSKAHIIAETVDWIAYDLPEELRGRMWNGNFRGQKQKWFAMKFDGDDSDIVLDTHKPEFKSWQWQPIAKLTELIVPFKRGVYAELIRRFEPLAERIRTGDI